MAQTYVEEQSALTKQVKVLREELAIAKEKSNGIKKTICLVKKYAEITELTPQIVRKFIEKAVVHQVEQVNGKKTQASKII